MGMLMLGAIPAQAQVVIWVRPANGGSIVVQNHPSSRTEAMRRANANKHRDGWKPLLESTVPGHGAMFCFLPQGGPARYFVVEGRATGTAAVIDARAQANAAAHGTGAVTSLCGRWNNHNAHPLQAQATPPTAPPPGPEPTRGESAPGLLDAIKQQVRERVTCDPARKNCPPPPRSTGTGVRG